MKSTIKNILSNRLFLLTCFDILIIYSIIWEEKNTYYEAVLPGQPDIYPLIAERYNAIIVAIIINMLVLVSDMERLYRKTYHKNYLVVAVVYFMFVIFCFLLGFSYIIPRDGRPVIDYGNILFVVPIEIFGKETVRSVINTGYLYVALSVAHIIICIKYIMSIVKMRNRELHGSKEEDSGACRCDGEPQ